MAINVGQNMLHPPNTLQTSAIPLSTTPTIPLILPSHVAWGGHSPQNSATPYDLLDMLLNPKSNSNNEHLAGRMGEPRFNPTGKGVLIGLLSALGSALLFMFILSIVYFLKYTNRGRILLDRIGRPGEFDDEQAFAKEEAEALEEMDDIQRSDYMRAKVFVESNPPESVQTDISLSQFLGIQEKGVSAWEFEPALEIANCFVEGRTEVEFFDTECSVQTNLPVPKQNEVYYWESKIYDKPDTTVIGIGMTTKPYPLFKMPGYHKTSLAYLSQGHRRFNQPFPNLPIAHQHYGPPYVRGDVVGVGYRPRSGTVFFTRNGKKLEDVTHTLRTQNLFPTLGATGPCTIHVNFGQAAFVYIEANVKKWGLAPMTGSLAPPPPYGSEQGSILLDQGQRGVMEGQGDLWASSQGGGRHARSRSAQIRLARGLPRSPGPQRSPTDISLNQFEYVDEEGEGEGSIEEPTGEGSSLIHGQGYEQITATGVPSTGNNIGLGMNMLGADQPPPEYSSPLERSPTLEASRSNKRRRDSDKLQRRRERERERERGGEYFDLPRTQNRYRDDPSDEEDDHNDDEYIDNEEDGDGDDERPAQNPRHDNLRPYPPRSISKNHNRRAQNVPPADRSPPVPYDVAVGNSLPGSGSGSGARHADAEPEESEQADR